MAPLVVTGRETVNQMVARLQGELAKVQAQSASQQQTNDAALQKVLQTQLAVAVAQQRQQLVQFGMLTRHQYAVGQLQGSVGSMPPP